MIDQDTSISQMHIVSASKNTIEGESNWHQSVL
jgi:hypothetical protein